MLWHQTNTMKYNIIALQEDNALTPENTIFLELHLMRNKLNDVVYQHQLHNFTHLPLMSRICVSESGQH